MKGRIIVPELETRLLTRADELHEIGPHWRRLHERSPSATLANSWEWMSTWWDVYRRPVWKLHTILFLDNGKLVAIAPFYRKPHLFFPELWMLGSGEAEADEVVSEYVDLVVDPDYETPVRHAAWEALLATGRWSCMRLDNVFDTSLVAGLQSRKSLRRPAGLRFRMRLPASWAEFLGERSANMRRKFVQARKDADTIAVEESVTRSWPDGGEGAFDQLASLHSARWQSREQAGAFGSELFCTFHRTLLERHASSLGAEIRILFESGKAFSATYNFCYGQTVYFYQSGFADCPGIRSPGVLAHSLAIEQAITEKRQYYDLMRGDSGGYKSRFGCETNAMSYLSHYRNGASGTLAYTRDRLLRWLRRRIRQVRQRAMRSGLQHSASTQ